MAREVLRAAASVTGVPVIRGAIRGKPAEHLQVSQSARIPFSAFSVAASVTSGDEAAGEPMPRVVYDGVVTVEEAKEATSELIVGIENIYPWSRDYDGYENSVTTEHELHSSPSNSQVEQAQASVSDETEPAIPTTVYKAFRLLCESSEVQNVVTSIACDPKVVKAVRENQQLQEFLHLERRRWAASNSVMGAERLDDMSSAEGIEHSSNGAKSKLGISFEEVIKITKDMIDMMKNLSNFLKNLFGGERAKSFANDDHGAPGASAEHVIEASLLGLAIMVIMLIFLKRV